MLADGTRLGRYTVLKPLGQGGMAHVYLADDPRHGRVVALKVLKPEIAAAVGCGRFLREIQVAARLSHPHIVPLFDSGEAEGTLFYVMPCIEGESLRDLLARRGALPPEEALRLAREIASALDYAHRQGLVHRDIKPGNILLSDGMALVSDFGIARACAAVRETAADGETLDASPETTTLPGRILGTPAYMAPEQIEGRADVDARADLYALACVIVEMLAGRPPFRGDTAAALFRQHLLTDAPPLSSLCAGVPRGLDAVFSRALAKDRAGRYPTGAGLIEALTFAHAPGAAPDGEPASPRPAAAGNLPLERTRFVGRGAEVDECSRLLASARLVTLTGIGGTGKTRLALRAAAVATVGFPGGTWFVDFATVPDGAHALLAVAETLSIPEEPGRETLDVLRARLAGASILFVFDNCETVLHECAALADAMLSASTGVRILATSREALGVAGEQVYPLKALPTRAAASGGGAAAAPSDAAALFLERARAAVPAFQPDASAMAVIEDICARLDGIPLAIELAAARVKVLSPEQLRERLSDRFRLLAAGGAPASRHHALAAALDWSYEQLAADERRLLRMLSAFSAGWSLESAVALSGVDEFELLERLSHLTDKSLIEVERRPGGGMRYRLLETVRDYAAARLAAAGETEEARARHLGVFGELAERSHAEYLVREEEWALRLEAELANLRTALESARAAAPREHLRLAGALGWFWCGRSHFQEGRAQLDAALAAAGPSADPGLRARALWWSARIAAWQGESDRVIDSTREAIGIWRGLGERAQLSDALDSLGWIHFLRGEDEAALAAFEEELEVERHAVSAERRNRARVGIGQILVALHRVDRARNVASEILEYSVAHGDKRGEHFAWHYLADCALIEGQCADALTLYVRSLLLARALGDRMEISFEVQGVAMSHAGLGAPEEALRLGGCVAAEWQRLGAGISVPFWFALLERYFSMARRALGPEAAKAAWDAGSRQDFEAVVAELARQAVT